MKPISELREPGRLRGLLFDIDETLTTDGKLTAEAYAALERLKRAGKFLIPVTGRPAGWCDHIARMWPVNAVVGENGAFYFGFFDDKLSKRYQHDADTRARNRARMMQVVIWRWNNALVPEMRAGVILPFSMMKSRSVSTSLYSI